RRLLSGAVGGAASGVVTSLFASGGLGFVLLPALIVGALLGAIGAAVGTGSAGNQWVGRSRSRRGGDWGGGVFPGGFGGGGFGGGGFGGGGGVGGGGGGFGGGGGPGGLGEDQHGKIFFAPGKGKGAPHRGFTLNKDLPRESYPCLSVQVGATLRSRLPAWVSGWLWAPWRRLSFKTPGQPSIHSYSGRSQALRWDLSSAQFQL